jgi:cytochrome c biogenesis protein CcmG, thiol:disulfide interchange protein DsbE
MARRLRLLVWTLAAAAALAALALFGLASSSSSGGRLAPALPREHLSGPPATAPSADGRAKLVIFWASWCPPCRREAAQVERFAQSAAGSGRVIGVDWSDGLSGARSFIRQYSWSFPNLRDGEGTVGNEYRIGVLPTTFALDAHGRIRTTLHGPQDERSLGRALAKALAS